MLEIPRSALRLFWHAVKRSMQTRVRTNQLPITVLEAEGKEAVLRTQDVGFVLRYRLPLSQSADAQRHCLPAMVLEQAEGRTGNVVVEVQNGKTTVCWMELGVPRSYEQPAKNFGAPPAFPTLPKEMISNSPHLLTALHEAAQCAAVNGPRYATNRVLLRGKGDVVGTDGKHLLLRSGFQFPWSGEVLVPRLGLFGANILPTNEDVQVGRNERYVFLQVGPWTVGLETDGQGRYPAIDPVIPTSVRTTLRLAKADVTALLKVLPQLPDKEGKDSDVALTVDLQGRPAVRWRDRREGPATELVLRTSQVLGPPVRFVVGRKYLHDALRLGFTEFGFVNPDATIRCVHGDDRYVFLPLSKDLAVPPGANVLPVLPETRSKAKAQRPVLQRASQQLPPMVASQRKRPLAGFVRRLVTCGFGWLGSLRLRRRKAA